MQMATIQGRHHAQLVQADAALQTMSQPWTCAGSHIDVPVQATGVLYCDRLPGTADNPDQDRKMPLPFLSYLHDQSCIQDTDSSGEQVTALPMCILELRCLWPRRLRLSM